MGSCYIIQGAQLCDDLEGVWWEGGARGGGDIYIYIYIYISRYIHTHTRPMHIVWQKLTQHCKAIILQLKIKNTVNAKKKKRKEKTIAWSKVIRIYTCLLFFQCLWHLGLVLSSCIKFLVLRVTPFLFRDFIYVSFIWKIYEGFLSDLPFLIFFRVKHSLWILLKLSKHSSVVRKG